MALAPGTKLGPYEIQSPLGAGGMGEVYRARDGRLHRDVAIKILPSHLSQNLELRERFEREARAVSQLSHPHICVLYDIGSQDGTDYLVLEYLEGETLGTRLRKGALPLDLVLKYGAQIADALDNAHRRGIVHRDLKPDNVMLAKSGVKLLDFGLVKPVPPSGGISSSSVATMTGIPLTTEGMLVGTFQYMSPEQLEGNEADIRSDIFALGCVLYEMATGKRAFDGRSTASVVAAIMSTEPTPLKDVAPLTPPALDRAIRKCMAKDPDGRWQSAGDLASELRWIDETKGAEVAVGSTPKSALWKIVAVLLVATAAAFTAYQYLHPPIGSGPSVRASILPPDNVSFLAGFSGATGFAISPDGTRLAFAAQSADGKTSLWVRSLAELNAQALANTERAALPFWSPDGQWIGFFSDGKMKKTPASGGQVQVIADAPLGRGGTWNSAGVIVYASSVSGPLLSVSANGGTPAAVTQLNAAKDETTNRWPNFLPDGTHFLYLGRSLANGKTGTLYVGSLGGGPGRPLFDHSTDAAYAAPGYLLFVRNSTLLAQQFDPRRFTLHGDALPVAENVFMQASILRASFSVSQTGQLVYQGSKQGDDTELIVTDRTGKQLRVLGESGSYSEVRLSPDGNRAAVVDADLIGGSTAIWIYSLDHNSRTRFTFAPATNVHPVWTPDGSQLSFASNRSTTMNIYTKPTTGAGEEKLLASSVEDERPQAWSPDSRYLLTESRSSATQGIPQLVVLPSFGDRKRFSFLNGAFWTYGGVFSPDGRWLAYVSHESGRPEVYVASFPDAASKWQVSSAGGTSPQWRSDGRELFFCQLDGTLIAAQVSATKDAFSVAAVSPLFQTRMLQGTLYWPYDAFADGQRFIMVAVRPESVHMPLTLLTNWPKALPR